MIELKKNKVMFYLTALVVALSVLFHILHRVFDIMPSHAGHVGYDAQFVENNYVLLQNILLILPVLLLFTGFMFYKLSLNKGSIAVWYTLALTFASISLISGGGGTVELHFSIFMVVAMCAYYESIKLISLMTAIFAVQHIIGLFWATELIFGIPQYTVGMIVVHALFLVLTSTATSIQIMAKRRMIAKVEMEKQQKEEQFNKLLAQTQQLTQKMEATTELVQSKSEVQKKMSSEMTVAFQEVASGMGYQNESIEEVNTNLNFIRELVAKNTKATEQLKTRFEQSKQVMGKGHLSMSELSENINHVSVTIENTATTIKQLHEHTEKIDETMGLISQVSDQTRLLSLNASIEAAKAGQEGRGFAVVAAEIRKLSDQSKAATEDIYDVLRGIIESSEYSLVAINDGLESTAQMQEASLHAVSGYTNMSEDHQYMNEMVQHITTMMNELNTNVSTIYSEMTQVAAVIEQGTAAMEELAASVQEQETINRDMVTHISKSNELAEQLKREFIKLNN